MPTLRDLMIYLDYNASTPVDPAVREAMLPYLERFYGNPSSSHAAGRTVKRAVEKARGQVAALLGADTDEIVFTSGGTEANNHVIKGVACSLKDRGNHIVISAIEHPAVTNPCRFLERSGLEVTCVGVDEHGLVDPRRIAEEIRPRTILVSIMHANNEMGTIQPIAEIAKITREGGVLFHTDAAQSCGKIATRVSELGVDFLSVAGHKVYGPQGIGALYIRRGVDIEPLHHGAGHERGRRGGTEAVPALVGLGVAAELAQASLGDGRIVALRDRLHDGLRTALGDRVVLIGHPDKRLPNTLAIGFSGLIGGDVLARCPQICASTGAACHRGKADRSAVLAAMDVPQEIALGAVRFSVGRFNTEAEIDAATEMITRAVRGDAA